MFRLERAALRRFRLGAAHTLFVMLILVRLVVKRLLMDGGRWFFLPGRWKQDMQLQVIRIYILR